MRKESFGLLLLAVVYITIFLTVGSKATEEKATLEQRVQKLELVVADMQETISSMNSRSKMIPVHAEKVTSKTRGRDCYDRYSPYWGVQRGVNPYRRYPATYSEYQYRSYTRRYHPEQEERNDYERTHGGDEVTR